VRVVQRGDRPGFAAEPFDAFRVARECRREDFQRDLASERRVLGPIDLAHPARSKRAEDFVVGKAGAGRECH
jgi:hypothetical protein